MDASGASQWPGATLVQRDGLVAVLRADPEAARRALARLDARWQSPASSPAPALDAENIFEHIASQAGASKDLVNRGDLAAARATAGAAVPNSAQRMFDASYQKGYVAHAAMESHAALAHMTDGRMTVWASTQTPFPTRDRIARALGLDGKNVRVITPLLGGGFGGKSADARALEAARLAQIVGRPVQVAWTRQEEFFNDIFDPAAVVTITTAIDPQGKITLWDYVFYAAGERAATAYYELPNARIRSVGRPSYEGPAAGANVHPFAVGARGGPGANMNVFAIESQLDWMASAAGIDPLASRLADLGDPRMRRVLQSAAAAFGWKASARPGARGEGRGCGMACVIDIGT